jgi:16S rRNA processing protein RimM
LLKIGLYTGTHGLKGEIKILSDFSRKDLIFIPGFKIYIKDVEYIIETHRKHKTYDMVTLKNINDIKDIIDLRGEYVYINKSDLNNVFLEEDLIDGFSVSVDSKIYKIESFMKNSKQTLIKLENNKIIPFVSDFVTDIDRNNKIVYMNIPEGLL